ncbi:hypothetical protein JXA02_02185 [candidate division KSB1 bacterium]|nr:hypothetical protein [candidate division KSB1 bacterium]RQW10452.1 MAG: hypothetical protein EH222_02415 [candidate division KSB1 bacterium]
MRMMRDSTHNVLMCIAPGITRAGRCAAPVNLLDIYPTLVELAGLPAKEGIEGTSLASLLRDPASK